MNPSNTLEHAPVLTRAHKGATRPAGAPWSARLVGDVRTFSREHRTSNGMLLAAAVISGIGMVLNAALGLPWGVITLTGVAVLAYLALYVWSRHGRAFLGPALLSLLLFALGYYPLLWITNFGLDGSIHFMALIGLVWTACILQGRTQHAFLALFVAVTLALFAAEYLHLLPLATYESRTARFVDQTLSFAMATAALVALVGVLRASHIQEHEKVVAYSDIIKATNRALELALARNELLAHTDELTGLPNRRQLEGILSQRLPEAERYERPMSFALFDIDHFKRVNDRHGHTAGDAVLADLGQCVRAHLRCTDVLARWGGEEFVLLFPETDIDGARIVAERVREAVAAHSFPGGLTVTVSIGVTAFRSGDTRETLIRRADDAAYAAKHGGRNRVVSA